MNVYDFDKTICKDDTETDFFFYCLFHHPINLIYIPYFLYAYLMHKLKKFTNKEYRNRTYLILKCIKDVDKDVIKFWKKRMKKILPWYLKVKQNEDLIISATPRFLLEPIFSALNIKNFIVSEFDIKNRCFIGEINYGEEKLLRFKKLYPDSEIDNFYSDSISDTPLMLIAKNAYLVDKKYNIIPWNNKN